MVTDIQNSELSIETLQLRKAALVFRAINHNLRHYCIKRLVKVTANVKAIIAMSPGLCSKSNGLLQQAFLIQLGQYPMAK